MLHLVWQVSSAMRNIFEMYGFEHFELAPEHSGRDEDVFFAPIDGESGAAASDEEGVSGSDLETATTDEDAAAGGASSGEEGGGGDEADASVVSPADTTEDYDSMKSVWAEAGWLRRNPIGVPTEREHYVLQQGLPVYRVLLVRTGKK
jgi:hypothetical protein